MIRVDIYGKPHNQLTVECRNIIMSECYIQIVKPVGDMIITDDDDCFTIPKSGIDKIFIQKIGQEEDNE